IKVDFSQIEQVILNLVINAKDAMPGGGALTISTKNITVNEKKRKELPELKAGEYVLISISDTGVGMPPEIVERLFEPFFTTKEQGTGLGLTTVYGIVKQSGGEIRAESRPGEGSVFRIYLPFANEPAEVTDRGRTAAAVKGVVLIAEDDESMRRISKRILNSSGYEVIEAVDGKEALKFLEDNSLSVSVLLTDIVMPELDGVGLAREVMDRYPHIRILCMSGYADKQEELESVLGAKVGYIQKPFTPDVFLRKLEDLTSPS
ncbi:MAG: ATP-binding protein, partial [Elusimicrobiota bacterium]